MARISFDAVPMGMRMPLTAADLPPGACLSVQLTPPAHCPPPAAAPPTAARSADDGAGASILASAAAGAVIGFLLPQAL